MTRKPLGLSCRSLGRGRRWAGSASALLLALAAFNAQAVDNEHGANALVPPLRLGPRVQHPVDPTSWSKPQALNAPKLAHGHPAPHAGRLEAQISTRNSALSLDRHLLGIDLDNGARITLRRSGGRSMIYYAATGTIF